MSDQVSDQTSTGRTAHTLVAVPIRAGDWITAVLALAPAECGRLTAAHYDPACEGVVEAEYAVGNGLLGKRASLLPCSKRRRWHLKPAPMSRDSSTKPQAV